MCVAVKFDHILEMTPNIFVSEEVLSYSIVVFGRIIYTTKSSKRKDGIVANFLSC